MNKIQIWNMALGWIGTRMVASETERTEEAVQCGLFWDNARRQVLRDFPWNVSQRRAWLAQVAVPAGWEGEYRFAYAVPADMLKALTIRQDGRTEKKFVLASDGSGAGQGRTVLLTNADRAVLAYTADVSNVGLFDDSLVNLLARKLAAMAAVPLLKNNSGKVQELENLYQRALAAATEANASEGAEEETLDSWIKARGI